MSAMQQQLAEWAPSSGPLWLSSLRQQGQQLWQQAQWPNRKTELWKYTSLRPLETLNFAPAAPHKTPLIVADEQQIHDIDAYRLVWCNGVLDLTQSDVTDLPEGVTCVTFSGASPEQVEHIKNTLNRTHDVEKHLFSALNNAHLQDGVWLHVGVGVQLAKPILLINIADTTGLSTPRVLVELEKSSKAIVIEQYLSPVESTSAHFACGITELLVGDNAELEHYRLHMERDGQIHIGGVHAALQTNARLRGFHLALGSALKRIDLVVQHLGEGAECSLNGVYLPGQEQLVDYHTCIEHSVPNCTTNEVFRGIVSGNGRAVFHGRIHIHPQAQKTSARLSNRNLLTSNKAEVDTKPELEIYADDVQCAHGATVAQLDETAMHYFRTRGISAREAEVMLSFGFINELLNTIRLEPIADYLRPLIAEQFARDPELLRHIA